jgi:two-component system, chemotaxis family, sensor kinase CheA
MSEQSQNSVGKDSAFRPEPAPAFEPLVIEKDMAEIVDGFVIETAESLEKLDQDLVSLDTSPDNKELVNSIFRILHTIKGNSLALGFEKMNKLVHRTEDVIRKVRDGEMRVTPSMMDPVFGSVDLIKALLNDIRQRRKSNQDISVMTGKLDEVLKSASAPEKLVIAPDMKEVVDGFIIETEEALAQLDQDLVALEEKTEDADLINKVFRVFHTIKGNSRALGFTKLEEVDHRTEDVIRLVRDGKAKIRPEMMDVVLRSTDMIKMLLADIKKGLVSSVSITAIESELALVCEGKYEELKTKREQVKSAAAPRPAAVESKSGSTTVRVDIGKLDKLIDVTGELVLNRNRLLNLTVQLEQGMEANELEESLNELNAMMGFLVSDIQSGVMSTRMQPIGRVFNKYPRIVRDMARELGKDIDLVIKGQDTELDATIVEEIGDPMIHMVRNSCDHGIETPDVRTAYGKNPKGRIELSAYHEGNSVVIEIRDDGKGMDSEVIKKKAVEKGIITEKQADAMSKKEILDIIFLPGFSTAAKVTAVSGRGVGMDVVKTGITRLKGTVELDSEPARGTTVKIILPLTLAVMTGLEVEAGEERYLIPQESIVEIVPLSAKEFTEAVDRKEFLFRSKYLNPVVSLASAWRNGHRSQANSGKGYIVVTGAPEKRGGILVDNVLRQHEVVIKPVGKYLNHFVPAEITGATIMGDGSVELILDAERLLQRAKKVTAESE